MNVRLAKLVTVYLDHPLVWWAVHGAATGLGVARPGAAWHLTSGQALERLGRARAALGRYEAACAVAGGSARRADVRWLHAAQFARERMHAVLAGARVADPLLSCRLVSARSATPAPGVSAGRFTAEFTHDGLRLFGFTRRGVQRVHVELDDHVIRSLHTGGSAARPEFTFTIRRATLAGFPAESRLRVRAADGRALRSPGGGCGFVVGVPHGDGSLRDRLGEGRTLDKKGAVPPNERDLARRRAGYLRLYDHARAAFEARFQRPLFLMYGTLLGAWRDGDLIPGDDDFDVGYVASATDPLRVKAETFDVIERLVEAGFTVSFNRRGRLFRLSHPAAAAEAGDADTDVHLDVHLDVRPLWFEDGRVWAHNHFSMPSSQEHWLPAISHRLGDQEVLVPRHVERFFEWQYGPGWRVPDPAFTYHLDAIPRSVLAHLARALITPTEYRALRGRLASARATLPGQAGFRSAGWDDLYPLERDGSAVGDGGSAVAGHA